MIFRHVACEPAHNDCGPTPKETGFLIYANQNLVFVSENINQLRYVSKCRCIMSKAFKILLLYQLKITQSMLRLSQMLLCNYEMLTMALSLIYQLWYLLTSSHLSATTINIAAWALHMTSQFHPLPPMSMSTASLMITLNLKK